MQMTQTSIPKWQIVTGWVLSGILAFVFLPSAFFKIAQPTGFLEGWTKSYPAGAALPLGIIELTIFVLYLVPKTRYVGGLLMLAVALAVMAFAGATTRIEMFAVPLLAAGVGLMLAQTPAAHAWPNTLTAWTNSNFLSACT